MLQKLLLDVTTALASAEIPYERHAIDRAVSVEIAGAFVRFATVEDLVIHKIVAGRPRDIEDAKGVLLRNPGCDEMYVRRWLMEFDKALGRECIMQFDALHF